MADLTSLLERVKAATGPDRELDAEIAVALSGDPGAWVVNPSPHSIFSPEPGWWRTSDDASHKASEFTASLDAALALVERVLPGWRWMARRIEPSEFPSFAAYVEQVDGVHFWKTGSSPALALLAALLSALIAGDHKAAQAARAAEAPGEGSRDEPSLPNPLIRGE